MTYLPQVIRHAAPKPRAGSPELPDILDAVALAHGMRPEWLTSVSRSPEYVRARWVYILLAREITGQSLDKVGYFINRTHWTVMHALEAAPVKHKNLGPMRARAVANLETAFPDWRSLQ